MDTMIAANAFFYLRIWVQRPSTFQSQQKSLGRLREIGLGQRSFGHPHILAGREAVDLGKKMGAEEAFGPGTFNGIAHFFPRDEPHTPSGVVLSVKKDKIGGMPRRSGPLVDRIKIARSAQAVEVF